MSAAGLTRRAQRAAERLMVDQVEIRGPDIPGELDEDTLERETLPGPVRYTGRCKVQTFEPHETPTMQGDRRWVVQRYHLHIPVSVAGVRVGDVATITAATVDPGLAGSTYRVAALSDKTFPSARRLMVDEITSPDPVPDGSSSTGGGTS